MNELITSLTPVLYNLLYSIIPLVGVVIGSRLGNQSAMSISRQEMKNQLRLAALDQRLEAHQNGYAMCNLLRNRFAAQPMDRNIVQDQFVAFWNKQCLYLGPKSRQHMRDLYDNYYDFGISGPGPQRGKHFLDLHKKTLEVLAEEIELPSLCNEEFLDEQKL